MLGYLALVFVTGILTGIHCIAMCGSMVLSYVAREGGDKPRALLVQHAVYNGARIFSYGLVGGALGFLGSVFTISLGMRGAISILAGAFMVLLGLQMLNVFPILRRLNLHFFGIRPADSDSRIHTKSSLTPALLLGLGGGLMPCGPLQAMELYAAGTGSAFQGFLVMVVFGIGTLPAVLSFGLLTSRIGGSNFELKRRLLKISAIVVIILGVMMLNRGLALNGIQLGLPILGGPNSLPEDSKGVQKIGMSVDEDGYHPSVMSVKRGVPVELTVLVKKLTACNEELVFPGFGLDVRLPDSGGSTVLKFTPEKAGRFPFTCGMGMLQGTIIVEGFD